MARTNVYDADYSKKSEFLNAVIISCEAVIAYAKRYAELALQEAERCTDKIRRQELMAIAQNCANVPENPAQNFMEACQSFWFIQMLIQIESSGHSISPGRFDQYMYPYYKKDIENGLITREFAQELMDCIWHGRDKRFVVYVRSGVNACTASAAVLLGEGVERHADGIFA